MSNQDETELPAPLEPDTTENSDVDSAYGESVNGMLTTSLGPSVLEYTYENGRRYHAYREGSYMLPNDEKEQDRLDLLHHIFKMLLKGELITAPIPRNPQRVLDFGTGTGIWALDFAHQHPSAVVIGTDLSPIQPEWTAPNCRFMIDDVEAPWTWQESEAFDFIHGRGMAGCIGDWSKLYSESFKHLKPGGYLEMQEYETWIRNDEDPEYKNAPFTLEWQLKAEEASRKFGKRLKVAAENKQKMIDAGFEDVTEIIHRLPIGPWPKGLKQKEIGTYQLVQSLEAVEPFTLAFFTRVLGWSHDEAQVLIAGVKNEMRRKKNHFYCLIHFVHGRKPKSA